MEPGENNALVVDFMSLMHGIHQGQLSTFQDLLNAAWKHIQGIWKFKQIDIICDSYVDDLLKECERLRRLKYDTTYLNDIEFDMRLPIQPKRFWASRSNKEKLQTLSRIYFKNISESNKTVINLSGYLTTNKVNIEAKQYYKGTSMDLPKWNCDAEEADICIILHLNKIFFNQNACAFV